MAALRFDSQETNWVCADESIAELLGLWCKHQDVRINTDCLILCNYIFHIISVKILKLWT